MLAFAEIRSLILALGAGSARTSTGQDPLSQDHPHDGRRRRRKPHPDLLLTFFFPDARHDRQGLPLHRAAALPRGRGQAETFLKDEKEKARFLLARLGEDRTLVSETTEKTASGAALTALVAEMQEWRGLVARLSMRGFPEALLRTLVNGGLTDPAAFLDRARLERAALELAAVVEAFEIRADEEHGGHAIHVTQAVNGVPKTGIVDAAFLAGYEMRKVADLAAKIDGFLDGPYRLKTNGSGAELVLGTLPEAVDAVLQSAEKGLRSAASRASARWTPIRSGRRRWTPPRAASCRCASRTQSRPTRSSRSSWATRSSRAANSSRRMR